MQLKIPVTLTPSAGGGWLAGETVTVSKFGARVALRVAPRKLACGETLAIVIHRARQSRTGRVVWLDSQSGAQCGIEIQQPRGFWGIYFPGTDEQDEDAYGLTAAVVSADPLTPAPNAEPESPPVAGCLSPAPSPLPPQAAVAPWPVYAVMDGIVSGVSAVYNSFAERAVFSVTKPDELTGLFTTPVRPGTRLRVMANARLLHTQVLTVGGKRVEGKWPVRLTIVRSCEDPDAN